MFLNPVSKTLFVVDLLLVGSGTVNVAKAFCSQKILPLTGGLVLY